MLYPQMQSRDVQLSSGSPTARLLNPFLIFQGYKMKYGVLLLAVLSLPFVAAIKAVPLKRMMALVGLKLAGEAAAVEDYEAAKTVAALSVSLRL